MNNEGETEQIKGDYKKKKSKEKRKLETGEWIKILPLFLYVLRK